MLTIYEYSHDATSYVEMAFLVAERQPLAGGYKDTPEDRAASARIFRPVAQVDSIELAREWIAVAAPAAMRRFTAQEVSLREVPHSQALLCVRVDTDD